MFSRRHLLVASVLFATPAFGQARRTATTKPALATPVLDVHPTVAQFLSPSSPLTLAASKKADRIAWMAYERGMRNVYTAAAPAFTPVRLTEWMKDDGIDITNVTLSDDGSIIIFVRGGGPNRDGWVANPSHDPDGAERAIWAVRSLGGPAWRLAEGSSPELSPDGKSVLYVKDGQIYRARTAQSAPTDSMQRGLKPFIEAWGRQSAPRWSPDGSRIAFVTDRANHALIVVYDVAARTVRYVAPSVDCDGSPVWAGNNKQIVYLRRPGVPFGLQAQQGNGGIGNPGGPGAARTAQAPGGAAAFGVAGAGGGCGGGGRGFGGGPGGPGGPGGGGGGGRAQEPMRSSPGFYENTFPGGYTLSVMMADVTKCTVLSDGCPAKEVWHTQPKDTVFTQMRGTMWADGNLVFPLTPPGDEFERYFSLNVATPQREPILLTTTNGLIEDQTSASISRDGKTLYYCTNANDIEKRHIWAVPTGGGTPAQVSTDDGIETYPQPLSNKVAVLYFNAAQPASVGLVPAAGGQTKIIFPRLGKDFPAAAHVAPQIVIVRSPDSLDIHEQLFLPKDLKPGERRPALIFVHGGPMRQMMPGYHYMQFYHWAYAYNQWLASQGYIVLSVNYRSGVGYGRSFRQAQNTNARGNSEYQDVLAAGKYLQTRADVDPKRIGIWGLSYGGLLTSQALARNSDLFIAGADLAGVHLYGSQLDSTALSFRSSAVGAIDGWKSPVFLVHGDDDRNVDFAQTVGLVSLLRARNIYYELMVVPDDVHESMIHENWVVTFNRMGDFFKRFVWNHEIATTMQGAREP